MQLLKSTVLPANQLILSFLLLDVLRHAESLESKIRYVRENPVRKGLVGTPEEYPWLWEG
jgi:hypothetical protein